MQRRKGDKRVFEKNYEVLPLEGVFHFRLQNWAYDMITPINESTWSSTGRLAATSALETMSGQEILQKD